MQTLETKEQRHAEENIFGTSLHNFNDIFIKVTSFCPFLLKQTRLFTSSYLANEVSTATLDLD